MKKNKTQDFKDFRLLSLKANISVKTEEIKIVYKDKWKIGLFLNCFL